jgi:hypothetical protein
MSARFKLVDNANPEPILLELHFQQPARNTITSPRIWLCHAREHYQTGFVAR